MGSSYFQLIPLFAGAINLLLAVFVFTRDVRLRNNQVFLAWGILLSIWNFGAFALFRGHDPSAALGLARMMHFAVIFIPVVILHLAALIARRPLGRWLYGAYALSALLALTNFTPYFIRSVRFVGYAWFAQAGPMYWIYLLAFSGMTWPALYLIWQARRHAASPNQRQRYTTLLLANGLLLALGSNDLLPILGIDHYPLTSVPVYPWGQVGAGIYGLLVAHSVLHDQILDVRISLGRQAATLLRLLFLLSIAYLLLALVALAAPHLFTVGGLLATLVVILFSTVIAGQIFPRLLGIDTERLERHILGDRFEYQEQLGDFISRLPEQEDLSIMLHQTLNQLRDVMRLKSSYIALLDPRTQELRSIVGFPSPLSISKSAFHPDAPIMEYFQRKAASVLDLRGNPQSSYSLFNHDDDSTRSADGNVLTYAFPLRVQNRLLGITFFGHKAGDPFTRIDFEVAQSLAIGLSHAVDRLRMTERAATEEKLELLATMHSALAHDLNNLITPINTYLQLRMEALSESDNEKDDLRTSIRSIQMIREYVKEAIFFAKSLKVNFGPANTSEIISETFGVTERRAAKRCCSVLTEDEARIDFLGDRVLLQRMLVNLVNNALDASPPGQNVVVRCSKLPATKVRKAWLRFEVIDHGEGISDEHLPHVFKPYYSTKDTGDQTRGFGLGLAIVQKVVLLHNGDVRIDSKRGVGTTLTVDIPMTPKEAKTS